MRPYLFQCKIHSVLYYYYYYSLQFYHFEIVYYIYMKNGMCAVRAAARRRSTAKQSNRCACFYN